MITKNILARDEDGQSMVEYAFILAFIALMVVSTLKLFGPVIRDLYIIAL